MQPRQKILLCVLIFLLFAASSVWQLVLGEERREELLVAFLDVGQGDAIFIESPTGAQVLIDGGPNRRVIGELGKVMPFGDRHIDMLVITNPDKDHYGGFLDVLEEFETDLVLESGVNKDTVTYKELRTQIEAKNIPYHVVRRGEVYELGGGVTLTILHPDRDVSRENSNDGSIVAKLSYGETEVLLTGDSTTRVERILLMLERENAELDSDILKVGHHGSRTSSSEAFVKAVSPEVAVISSGASNTYGHPHKEILNLFSKFEIPVLRTDQEGLIIYHSDGKEFTRE